MAVPIYWKESVTEEIIDAKSKTGIEIKVYFCLRSYYYPNLAEKLGAFYF